MQVFPYGLAEEELACQVVSDDRNVADGHVLCNHEQLDAYNSEMKSRGTVHTVRMDSFLSGAHFDVVKIDVEGYEPRVLAGAGACRLLLPLPFLPSICNRLLPPPASSSLFIVVHRQRVKVRYAVSLTVMCPCGHTHMHALLQACEAAGRFQV